MQDPNNPTIPNQPTPSPAGVTPGVVPVIGADGVQPNVAGDGTSAVPNPFAATPAPATVMPSLTSSTQPLPSAETPMQPGTDMAKNPSVDTHEKSTPQQSSQHDSNGQLQVKKADIEKVVSNWTGIPITKLTEDEGAKLLNLEKRVHQRLIDQEEAVTAVAEAVRRGRIGLAAANRPIASFIFLGPSGTGKTELAKTIAEILFGRDDLLIRLDMSEYMEKHEVAKLIGAPPGYVGYEEGGQLTEAVRAKPYSIVLLDEVEKAHPDVFNILLQLLEDGRLTDNKGNTISFKNTIVICTSNIGSAQITQKLGEKDGKPQTQDQIDKSFTELSSEVSVELHKFFRPELLNRFDDIVIFKPLRRQDMAAIAKLGIEKTGKLLKEQDIKIKIMDKALQQLALEGYDPMYGARPLRRLIQTAIENPIAVLLISKTFVAGDTIVIDYDTTKSDYSFKKATPEDIASDTKGSLTPNTEKADEEKLHNPTDGEPSMTDTKKAASSDSMQPTLSGQTTGENGQVGGGNENTIVSPQTASMTTPDLTMPSLSTNGIGLSQVPQMPASPPVAPLK